MTTTPDPTDEPEPPAPIDVAEYHRRMQRAREIRRALEANPEGPDAA